MLLPTLRIYRFNTFPYALLVARTFSQVPTFLARKDTQHKDSLKPESDEYSKSGSDDAAAAIDPAAFGSSQTRPEQEMASAAKESGENVSSSEDMLDML